MFYLDGTRLRDDHLLLKSTALGSEALNGRDDIHTINNLAEDDVSAIEPAGDNSGNEKLGTVGVLAGIGHAQQTWLGVLDLEVLIGELLAVDGLATGAIALGEVTALKHELGDDTVESGALVAEAVLLSAELTEVLSGSWDDVVVELEGDAAGWLAVDLNVEEAIGHFEKIKKMGLE
ncbi:hypothetical protein TWF694_009548 [Orbilia ellipsospora]|uniref:Uncharacterized protein n=1 Tax=Orbilia ellipsospora TaxID=2528407 RepID=A0AAV9XC01_9PEZI